MLRIYSQFSYDTNVIIYNQMLALAKNEHSAVEKILKNICRPPFESPVGYSFK